MQLGPDTARYLFKCQQILIKSTAAKESLKSRLFNNANYTVIANTATEIEALKDRPFIPERHIVGL